MEKKVRLIEQEYWVSDDGREFLVESECVDYEMKLIGRRKTCDGCGGNGKVVKDNDIGGDGGWGSSTGVRVWVEECKECGGKGYLEKVEIWK